MYVCVYIYIYIYMYIYIYIYIYIIHTHIYHDTCARYATCTAPFMLSTYHLARCDVVLSASRRCPSIIYIYIYTYAYYYYYYYYYYK